MTLTYFTNHDISFNTNVEVLGLNEWATYLCYAGYSKSSIDFYFLNNINRLSFLSDDEIRTIVFYFSMYAAMWVVSNVLYNIYYYFNT